MTTVVKIIKLKLFNMLFLKYKTLTKKMKKPEQGKHVISLLAANILVLLTAQSGNTFTLIEPTNPKTLSGYTYTNPVTGEQYDGATLLTEPTTNGIPLGGSTGLWQQLNDFSNAHPGEWEFTKSNKSLDGLLGIESISACGYGEQCGPPPKKDYGVGADISVEYVREKTDPSAYDLRWIQWVTSNHSITGNHGTPEDKLDIDFNSTSRPNDNPYYYDKFSIPATFDDTPYREDPDNNHFWNAELYLASVSKQGGKEKVTIYNGFKWGWTNLAFPNNSCQGATVINASSVTGSIGSPCPSKPGKKVDLEFLFDTTGSMGSYIKAVQTTAKNILKKLDSSGTNYRVAVADYKDFPNGYGGPGDYPYKADLPFSTDETAISAAIDSMSGKVGGGGDTPESAYSGLIRSIDTEGLGSWRNGAQKAVIVMSDAAPHDPEPFTGYTSQDVIDAADAVDPATIYSIVPGGDPSAVSYFSQLSAKTSGKLYTTSSSDDIANALLDITDQVTAPTDVPEPDPSVGTYIGLSILGIGCFLKKKLSYSTDQNKKSGIGTPMPPA